MLVAGNTMLVHLRRHLLPAVLILALAVMLTLLQRREQHCRAQLPESAVLLMTGGPLGACKFPVNFTGGGCNVTTSSAAVLLDRVADATGEHDWVQHCQLAREIRTDFKTRATASVVATGYSSVGYDETVADLFAHAHAQTKPPHVFKLRSCDREQRSTALRDGCPWAEPSHIWSETVPRADSDSENVKTTVCFVVTMCIVVATFVWECM